MEDRNDNANKDELLKALLDDVKGGKTEEQAAQMDSKWKDMLGDG